MLKEAVNGVKQDTTVAVVLILVLEEHAQRGTANYDYRSVES